MVKQTQKTGWIHKEYKNKYKHLEEECQNTLKLIGSNNLIKWTNFKGCVKGFYRLFKKMKCL